MPAALPTLRPISASDRAAFADFVARLSPASRTHRFLHPVKELAPAFLDALTRPDPRRHVCLVAEEDGVIVAEGRFVALEDGTRGEFAIAVADDWQRRGIGARLLGALMLAARRAGVTLLEGEVLRTNAAMLAFLRRLGFRLRICPGDARLTLAERSV